MILIFWIFWWYSLSFVGVAEKLQKKCCLYRTLESTIEARAQGWWKLLLCTIWCSLFCLYFLFEEPIGWTCFLYFSWVWMAFHLVFLFMVVQWPNFEHCEWQLFLYCCSDHPRIFFDCDMIIFWSHREWILPENNFPTFQMNN